DQQVGDSRHELRRIAATGNRSAADKRKPRATAPRKRHATVAAAGVNPQNYHQTHCGGSSHSSTSTPPAEEGWTKTYRWPPAPILISSLMNFVPARLSSSTV